MKFSALTFLTILAGWLPLQAQHFVSTTILEKDTKKPLEFAAVRLLQQKDSSLVS